MPESNSKACTKCGQVKPFSDFFRNQAARDGLQSYCKPCLNSDKLRRYREKHPPRIKPPIPAHKACNRCGVDKPLAEYSPAKAARDKHRATCKACAREVRRLAYRAAHPLPEPKPPATEKTCSRCGVTKPLGSFHRAKGKGLGVVANCKECVAASHKRHTFRYLASDTQAPSEKLCPRCTTTKPSSDFFPNKVRKDKLSVYCQVCQREYVKEKQYDKKRYAELRDAELARGRVYRAANIDKVRDVNRLSRRKNRHKRLGAIAVANRARKLRAKEATPKWADKKAMAEVYNEARRMEREDGLKRHVDHIVPLHGKNVCGLHVECNLRIVLAQENLIKTNKFEVQ